MVLLHELPTINGDYDLLAVAVAVAEMASILVVTVNQFQMLMKAAKYQTIVYVEDSYDNQTPD